MFNVFEILCSLFRSDERPGDFTVRHDHPVANDSR